MTSYSIKVAISPSYRSISAPVPSSPPASSLETLHESFRCNCLVKYHHARLNGLDHLPAIKEASRLLRLSGHPWGHFDLVAKEINQALGRRPGRSRSASKDQP